MGSTIRRYAPAAGMLGALSWLIAHTGIAFGEIEYQDPTRPSPMPDWVVPVGIVTGALLIAFFTGFSGVARSKSRFGAGGALILGGTAVSLVPVWPFIFLGPFLIAIGFFVLAVAAWKAGRRGVGIALHAFGLPLSLPSGIAFDALGMDGAYGGLLFGAVLTAGIAWRAYESAAAGDQIEAVATGAPA